MTKRQLEKILKLPAGYLDSPFITKSDLARMKRGLKPARKRAKKKRNPVGDAAALSEAFHGRPVETVSEYEETELRRRELADLGRLIELGVWTDEDVYAVLRFKGNVRCAASGDGRSIYFVGGDQALNLADLGIEDRMVKDHVRIGDVASIVYHTSKVFHDFEPSDYEHQFGEDSGNLPVLNYDTLNRRLFLVGGSYEVRPEGIVD